MAEPVGRGSPPSRRLLRFGLLGALAGFALLNILAFHHARAMLFFADSGERTAPPEALSAPRRAWTLLTGARIPRPKTERPPESVDLNCTDLAIPVPDEEVSLGAWYCGDGRSPLVLLFHGYADEKSSLLEEAAAFYGQHFAAVLLVDFRGSGASSEDYTTVGVDEARDVAAAVDFARAELVADDVPLVLFGRSMGAAAILRAVAEHGVRADGYVLESVFDDLLHTVRGRFKAMGAPSFPAAELLLFWGGRQAGFDGFTHRPVEYAADVDAPMVLLHGVEDPRVSVAQARAVVEAAAAAGNREVRLHVMPCVGHEPLLAAEPEVWRRAVGWLLAEVEANALLERQAPAQAAVHVTEEEAIHRTLTSIRPDRRPMVETVELVPLHAVLSTMDPKPYVFDLPESLWPWAKGEDDTLPLDEPLLQRLHYVVRGSGRPPAPPWEPTPSTELDRRERFAIVLDAQDLTTRLKWFDSEGGTIWLDAWEAAPKPPFPHALQTATPSAPARDTRAPQVRKPTAAHSVAQRIFAAATPWELSAPGPQLATTLAAFPMAPGTRRQFYDVFNDSDQHESWWDAAIEIDTVADLRTLRPDLALVWLERERYKITHAHPDGAPEAESPPSAWYRVIRGDEIYDATTTSEFEMLVAYFGDPAAPTAAPMAVRLQMPGGPHHLPVPVLRVPLTEPLAPLPSLGIDWRLTTPEPPPEGLTPTGPCATIYTEIGSTALWRDYCEGLGITQDRGYKSGYGQWSRRLIELRQPDGSE